MYKLLVYHKGGTIPHAVIHVSRAAEVIDRIPEVLAAHGDCEHIVVTLNDVRLFAVDCAGNRLP